MRLLVAGGTGLLGRSLVGRLRHDGHTVAVLTRRATRPGELQWSPSGPRDTWAHALDDADAVVNLTGAPLDRRWTAAYRQEIYDSRVLTTRALVEALGSAAPRPRVLVNGSAVGIYGSRGAEMLTEESPIGSGFLPSLGAAWEGAALAAPRDVRTIVVRTGVVLARDAGALPRMALPFRFFVGGPLGSGRQYLSWIHLDDWVAMVRWALQTPAVSGVLNATAPEPVTYRAFARTLGRALRRPSWAPAPPLALKIALGAMSQVIIDGQRVLPQKALGLGFEFEYPTLEGALQALCGTRSPARVPASL